MKGSRILIITGGIGLIIGVITLFFYLPNYFNLFGGVISLVGFILGIYWEKKNSKSAQLNKIENTKEHKITRKLVEKVEEKITSNAKEETINSKLIQLMSKISISLQKENFSKDELLRRLNKPIYCLLFHKTEEASLSDKNLKTLRDNILPSLGFIFVRGSRGVYILPPSQLPLFKDRNEITKWVENKIMKKIPFNYRYIFSFVSLIDLRFTISIKKDKLTKKYDTLIETINAEELLSFSEGLSYLQKKKNLSLKDIIEIPNLFFLSDNTSLDFKKKNILKDKNEEIIDTMKKYFKREIFTKDLIDIDSTYLFNLLKIYVPLNLNDIQIIKTNAKFWGDFLNNSFLNEKSVL
jgi:hypothetical protein